MSSYVFDLIEKEQARQHDTVELIASENFVSENVLKAIGSCLTNKYSEGYPLHRETDCGKRGRYYGGCAIIDELEEYCCHKWREVFQTDYHVNVQPHSGSQANMAAYFSVLSPGDKIMSMSLNDGGHLTHGSSVNFSGKLYDVAFYGVNREGLLDYGYIEQLAMKKKPKLIVAGASAYSRVIDFERIGEIAKRVGCIFMVDMSHIAGLIAAGLHPSPFGIADIITTTTHKTLRGARGGLIFCKPEFAERIDKAIFPGIQGGALQNMIAGKAVAAEEACSPEFKEYIANVLQNCKAMSDEFTKLGFHVVTGGTDNHLFLLDFTKTHPSLTGLEAQTVLERNGITVNKNCIPGEQRSPAKTSGIRIGTAAETTKGKDANDFVEIARRIDTILAQYKAK